jgi:hypothetical protein
MVELPSHHCKLLTPSPVLSFFALVFPYLPVVPHKAVAEVSKIGNLYKRLVVVNQGWQSEATDGAKGD